LGETIEVGWENGVLEHTIGNISETRKYREQDATLSQGVPRDAAVNFGTYIEVFSGIALFSLQ